MFQKSFQNVYIIIQESFLISLSDIGKNICIGIELADISANIIKYQYQMFGIGIIIIWRSNLNIGNDNEQKADIVIEYELLVFPYNSKSTQ